MAIRKFRKTMKPVIWVVTVAFVVSIFFIGAAGSMGGRGGKTEAFNVNGKKISGLKVQRDIELMVENYRRYYQNKADYETVKLITVNNEIDNALFVKAAGERKISVSGKEVDEKFKEMASSIAPSIQEFERMLRYQGLTIRELKSDLKDDLLASKVKDDIRFGGISEKEAQDYYNKNITKYKDKDKEKKFGDVKAEIFGELAKAKITDADVSKYYEENKSNYDGKAIDDVKDKIKDEILNKNTAANYTNWLENAYKKAVIKDVAPEYKALIKNDALIANGKYTFDNVEVYNMAFTRKLYYGATDEKSAFTQTIDALKEDVAVAQEAETRGLKTDKVSKYDKISDLREKLTKDIEAKLTFTDAEIKTYFEKNKTNYETKETVNIKPIMLKIEATEADKAESKAKAENLLKEAIAGKDFAKLAADNSADTGSAKTGGELGWFGKGQMVKEFEEAVFSGEAGKVYPKVVKSQFGYHIIKVEEKNDKDGKVRAAHILIKDEPSEKTKADIKAKADALAKELSAPNADFDKAMKEKSQLDTKEEIKDINKEGYINNIGYEKALSEEIFKMKENDVKLVTSEKGVYIVKLTKHTPFKEAKLDDVKDKVITSFKKEKTNEAITKIKTDNKNNIKVEFVNDQGKAIEAKLK